jgi:SAM-dependent methyltransferase
MIRIPLRLAWGHGGRNASAIGTKWAETFETLAGLRREDHVLDIGCGPGRMAIAIGERFGWRNPYFGFDTDRRSVAFCTKHITATHPEVRFAHLDIRNGYYNARGAIAPQQVQFPAEPGTHSFAFATSVFTHMFRDEVEHYVGQTHAALRPGGTFLSSWFLVAPEARATPRFNFRLARADGTFVTTRYKPERAVAYPLAMAEGIVTAAGFELIAMHRGAWAGSGQERHSQDILIARKPLPHQDARRFRSRWRDC